MRGLNRSPRMPVVSSGSAPRTGLNRYDGYAVRALHHQPGNPDSLAGSWNWVVTADSDGALWVGAEAGGLDRLDPRTGQIRHYRFEQHNPQSMIPGAVRAIIEAPMPVDPEKLAAGQTPPMRIWVGTEEGGVAYLDQERDVFVRYGRAHGLATMNVKSLLAHDGAIWIGTGADAGADGALEGGVYRLDPQASEIVEQPWAAGRRVRAMAIGGDGGLWFATYENGLIRLDPGATTVRTFRHDPADSGSLSSNSVRALLVDDRDRLWVGTNGSGLNYYDADLDRFQRFQHDPTRPDSLSSDNISTLFQDRGGVLWVGTNVGVNKWNPNIGGFQSYSQYGDTPDALSGNIVHSIASSGDGHAWVGTQGAGLNYVDLETGRATHYRHDPLDDSTIADDRVYAILEDGDQVWIGTMEGGLSRLDRNTGRFNHYQHDPDDPASISRNGITAIMKSTSGELWLGTFGGGINRMRVGGDGFERFRHDPEDPMSLSTDKVLQIIETANGEIWIATYDGGINRYLGNGRFQTIRHDSRDPNSLGSDNAWLVHEDAAGNLWVGTSNAGLNLWRAADRARDVQRFERLGVEHGMPSNIVYGLLSDLGGGVWASSNKGLTHFDASTGVFTNYGTSHGLLNNDFNFAAAHRAPDGRLMFGNTSGFNTFYPNEVTLNRQPPELVLTGFLDMNEQIDIEALSDSAGVLQLGHKNQLVTFEYAALEYTAPEQHRYQHRMRGFDDAWVDDGRVRRATYTNLDPGTYEFQVRATNSDGVWSEQVLSIPIVMSPPPWYSNQAIAAYTIIALLIGYGVYRDQRRRLNKNKELRVTNAALRTEIEERIVQQRAVHELERRVSEAEKMEALGTLSRGIAHDFNNILSAIMGFAELSLLQVDRNTEVAGYLRRLETSAERARELVHSILTFSRQTRQDPKPCDVVGVVQGVLQIVEPSLPPNVTLLVHADDDTYPVMADPTQLSQLAMNLLTNAYQAIDESGGRVSVTIRNVDAVVGEERPDGGEQPIGWLEFKVSDSGSGMDSATQDRVFDPFFTTKDRREGTGLGLSVVHGIVTQIGGQVTVDSRVGAGSTFTVLLPGCAETPDVFVPVAQHPTSLEGGNETILFVDDERSIVTITREMLTKLGYTVLTAGDGDTALVQFKALNGKIDLVISDQKMPHMLGSDLAKAIHALDADVPIILISGDGAEHAKDAAVTLFLHKPFTQEELATGVRRALDRSVAPGLTAH